MTTPEIRFATRTFRQPGQRSLYLSSSALSP
jgi:hypothetical protein